MLVSTAVASMLTIKTTGGAVRPTRGQPLSFNDPTPDMTNTASSWLEHQPASTLRAMGQSVVATIGSPDYPAALRQVFRCHPVYLIAGQRSRSGWNPPDYAWEECAGYKVIKNSGHLMMLEQPAAFVEALKSCLVDEIDEIVDDLGPEVE